MNGDKNDEDSGSLPSTVPRFPLQPEAASSSSHTVSGKNSSFPSTEPHVPLQPEPAASSSHTISGKSFDPDSDELLTHYKRIQWLQNRQKNLQICIDSDKFRNESAGVESDELINVIETLHDINYKKTTNSAIEELGISRLQLANMLHVLVNDAGDALSDEMAIVKKQVMEMLEQHTKLSMEVVKEMENVKNLQEEILKMELELSDLSAERMHQMQRIATRDEQQKQVKENASKDKKIEKLELKIEHNTKVLCTMNQIMQSVIAGSGVNWAKEDDIRELLFLVSKPIEVQIRECMEVQDAA